MKKAILILFVLLSAAGIRAQIRSVECTAPRPGLYERTDFTIRLTARYDNAYLQEQVALDMLITTPSGAERMLPCYWVEGASVPSRAGKPVSRLRKRDAMPAASA